LPAKSGKDNFFQARLGKSGKDNFLLALAVGFLPAHNTGQALKK